MLQDYRLQMLFAGVRQDFRYALRGLARTPGFTLAAALTIALGLGANVAMFSVLYAVVLKPLPYRDPDRLVLLQAETVVTGTRRPLTTSVRSSEFDAWRSAQTFERPAFFVRAAHALSTPEGTEQIDDALVSPEFFGTMGGRLVAGRPLGVDDDAAASLVISERLARRLFNDAAGAVNQQLTLNGRAFTVVGVAAADFQFPERVTDAWLPARFVRTFDPRDLGFQMIGRVRGHAPVDRLNAEVESIARAQPGADKQQLHGRVVRLADQIAAPVTRALGVLFAAVTLVLLVACINLANLLLARNAGRTRDAAIRAALGASRGRLVVQSFIETACLAVLGAVAGVALAYALIGLAVTTAGTFVPNVEFARLDVVSLGFAFVVMLFTALVAGAAPALVGAWSANEPRLTVTTSNRPHQRVRWTLSAVEWGVAFVLLVSASLLARSLSRLMTTDLGVAPDHTVTASLNFGFGQRPAEEDVIRRARDLLDRIKRLPGVETAGLGTSLPPQTSRIRITLTPTGESLGYAAAGVPVSPEYFPALRIPLLQGRLFNDSDDASHPDVVIMSADAARRFFGTGNVIGRTMKVPRATWLDVRKPSGDMTLVGVIGNVKYSGLSSPPDDAIYRPFAQQPWIAPFLIARTTVDPVSLIPAIRREIREAEPGAVVSAVKTLDGIMSDASAQPRAQTVVLVALTTLALVMAAVGLYGVMAFSVVQRTKEIGVRIALGATRGRIVRLILREGLTISVAGLAIGVAAAAASVRLLQSSLFGVSPTDPMSFVLAALVLIAVAALASYIPARRAATVDPLIALRYE